MGTEFPAKTVVLVFTDDGISGNRLGHFRALPGASVFGQLSHSLSATWMRMEVRPDLEDGSDSLMDVLTHEVAHYYWHHRFASRAGQKFDLDEGAAHFLEYKLGGNEEVRMSAQLAAVCQGIYRSEETSSSQWRSIISILDPDLSDAQIRWLQSSEEFIEQVLGVCRQREFLSRYGSAGAFIQAEEIMGASLFRQAFREVWESSKDDALDAPDVRDALCARTTWGKCEAITAAFAAYGFEP